jgi:hypothetical protein
MQRDEDLWTAAGRPMRPRSPSPHYTHAPSQLTDQSSLCGFNARSMVQRMSGLVQKLRDLCCWWSLEQLRDEEAHQQGLRLLKQNLSPSQRIQLEMLNYFDVVGGNTGALYRIHLGDRMNIAQLDTSDNRVRGIFSCLKVVFPSAIRCWPRSSRSNCLRSRHSEWQLTCSPGRCPIRPTIFGRVGAGAGRCFAPASVAYHPKMLRIDGRAPDRVA